MKNINKLLEKWFSENLDIDLTFKKDDTFGYDDLEETVYYSFTEKSDGDKYFRELCEKIWPGASEYNDFILSLFHEVGHSLTEPYLSDRVLDGYEEFIDNLGELNAKTYKKYYNHPVEKSATKAGLVLIKSNQEKVKELENIIFNK